MFWFFSKRALLFTRRFSIFCLLQYSSSNSHRKSSWGRVIVTNSLRLILEILPVAFLGELGLRAPSRVSEFWSKPPRFMFVAEGTFISIRFLNLCIFVLAVRWDVLFCF